MRKWIDLCEANSTHVKLYHLTDDAHFNLDSDFAPQDNSISITDRSGVKGLYVVRDVHGIEHWLNGHGYWRPFVVELDAEASALEHDQIGRWGGEIFIPASQFDKLTVARVVPLDAFCREVYGLHGWVEQHHGVEFDSGNKITSATWERPFANYRYQGDVRQLPPEEIARLKQDLDAKLT